MEAHLAELARPRELAYVHGQISAGVQGSIYRGKAARLYEHRLHVTGGIDADLCSKPSKSFLVRKQRRQLVVLTGCLAISEHLWRLLGSPTCR
jgi:hypothetical protein